MKTRIITIISAVVLFAASVNVSGQDVCNMDFSKLSIEEIKEIVSKLPPEQQKALLNSTNADCKLLQDLIDALNNGQKAVQKAQNGDPEGAACQANSPFDGNRCKETGQGNDKNDSHQKSDSSKDVEQVKNLLEVCIKSLKAYNVAAEKYNESVLDKPMNYDNKKEANDYIEAHNKAHDDIVQLSNNLKEGKLKNILNNRITPNIARENLTVKTIPSEALEMLEKFIPCDDCLKKEIK